jgi:hypothetical protein
MATMGELNEYRDRLRAARYSGARAVQDQNGERVEFRSDRELAGAMAALEAEIAAMAAKPASRILFQTSKGV